VIDHPEPGSRLLASAVSRYGTNRDATFIPLESGTTYGFASMDFIQRPALWFDAITNLSGHRDRSPQLRLRPIACAREAFQGELEDCDLRSLKVFDVRRDP